MYAKLENNNLTYAPSFLTVDNTHIWNAPKEIYLSQGWYPIKVEEQPEIDEYHYFEPTYIQKEDCILQSWIIYEIIEEGEEGND